MKIWSILTEYIETNKVIHGVEFSKKWKVLKNNHGEPVRYFFSRIDALCAEKVTKCLNEVPKEDIIALVVTSFPQDPLDRTLEEEKMIGKGWDETKKEIVCEAERHRKVESIQRPFYRDYRRTEANTAEPSAETCFVCHEPGHRKRDCPVFKASLVAKGIDPVEYQVDYDRKRTGNSGGWQNRGGSSQARGSGGSGRSAPGEGRRRDSGRGNPGGGRGSGAPNHYGPTSTTP